MIQNKSKKAFMLGEFTMKIIIAVLCIALLLYLLVAIFGVFSSQKSEQAKATLQEISDGADVVASENTPYETILYEPKGWVLGYYANRLGSCPEQCLCLCEPESDWILWGATQLAKCNDKTTGACLRINGISLKTPFQITTNIPVKIKITQENGKYILEKVQ
jgi:hypothetical protein